MDVSVVVPIFNEEESLPQLYKELRAVLESLRTSYEIILVDDGSTDGTFKSISNLHKKDSRVKVISFRRNFGQTAALAAGFDYAKGKVIITIDSDLENDPKDIPRLLRKIEEGYDVVSGWRKKRWEGSLISTLKRRIPSLVVNKAASLLTGVSLHDTGCTLKAYRREVIKGINLYGEMHRFIPVLTKQIGAEIVEVEVNFRSRKFGKTNYGLGRTFKVFLDLILLKFLLSYATRPIHFFGGLGIILFFSGTAVVIYLAGQRLLYQTPLADRPLFLIAILAVLTGIQLTTIGILGELTVRTYYETQKKPVYFVKKVLL